MFFKEPLPECSSDQFLKIIIFYCTVNTMIIYVVVDMQKWCYCMLIDMFELAVGFLILEKHDLFVSTISPISNRNMNQCFVFTYVFCLTLISLPIYSKNFLDLRFVPLLGLIFNYIYNSRKVLATPHYLEVYVPCQEGERSCICLLVSIDFASCFDSEVFFAVFFILLEVCITSSGT